MSVEGSYFRGYEAMREVQKGISPLEPSEVAQVVPGIILTDHFSTCRNYKTRYGKIRTDYMRGHLTAILGSYEGSLVSRGQV